MHVTWNHTALDVNRSTVFPAPYLGRKQTSFVIFAHTAGGELAVHYDQAIQAVCIRPQSLGLTWIQDGSVVRVRVDRPCNFSLEINHGTDDALLVFASGPDQVREQAYEHVLYFPSGEHTAGIIEVEQDNTLIVLDAGAKVHGKILAENKRHVAVSGRGILSMENFERHRESWQLLLDLSTCTDVIVENVTITDSCGWSCRVFGCEDVQIRNLKIIGQRGNSDGIDICGSRRVLVEGCFTRVWDDSLVAKAFDSGDLAHVLFRNCTLWNDFARPIEVGVELRAERVHDIRFENIDIIHSPTGYPLMGIHHGDRATVSDIHFENIRIEDTPGAQLFDIRITDSVWNEDRQKGPIRDIFFRNISVLDTLPVCLSRSRIQGYDDQADVRHVVLENIRFQGQAARDAAACGLQLMDHVSDVQVLAGEGPFLEPVQTEIEPADPLVLQPDGFYRGSFQVSLTNTTGREQSAACWYKLSPSGRGTCLPERETLCLLPGATVCRTVQVAVPPGKFCLHLESPDSHVLPAWRLIGLDLVLPEDLSQSPAYPVTNCRGETAGSVRLALRAGNLLIASDLLKTSGIVLYAAKPVPTAPGQVVFSVEETDQGLAPAVISGRHGLELAPQLRCPAEISYVFKNEPKVDRIARLPIAAKINGVSVVPLALLGLDPDGDVFWLEIEAQTQLPKRYPVCLFGSQVPDQICHMFARAVPAAQRNRRDDHA
ncbi:MAG: hypothetical protein GX112_06990 [Clostridiaceae bacterium]|nr:hypothetical protein [Clostridiaceae bacterium]